MTRDNALRLAASRMYLTQDDVLLIQTLVREMLAKRPDDDPDHGSRLHVANLGAGSGTTALAVLDEYDEAHIYTYDIDQANLDWTEQALRNCYPDAGWFPRLMDAEDGGRQGEPYAIDLLLHDASHERANVDRDLRAWVPRLADDALIWVHDYFPPPETWGQPASPGVAEAVHALIEDGVVVTAHTHSDGKDWPRGLGCVLRVA